MECKQLKKNSHFFLQKYYFLPDVSKAIEDIGKIIALTDRPCQILHICFYAYLL